MFQLHSDLSKKAHLFCPFVLLFNKQETPARLTKLSFFFFHHVLFILVANTCLKIVIFIQSAHVDFWRFRQSSSLSKQMNSAYMRLYFCACVRSDLSVFLTPLLKWMSHCSVKQKQWKQGDVGEKYKHTFSKAASVYIGNCNWHKSKTVGKR